MKILAIETSCDDTCVALAQAKGNNFSILREIISSQAEVHKKWGGVFPSLAKREHQKNIVPILKDVLDQPRLNKKTLISQNKLRILKKILERDKELEKRLIPFLQKSKIPNLDLIAVTQGPGLEPCLWVGVNAAKALSFFWNVPLIGINHIEAHIFVNFLIDNRLTCPEFVEGTCPEPIEGSIINNYLPAICLVVSGGHTQLALMKGLFKYKILGETKDDAIGEAFDKIGRMLEFSYPAGVRIEKLAKKGKANIDFPSPMINQKNYDFSYAGLKTAVLYHLKKHFKTKRSQNFFLKESFIISEEKKANICASFQKAAFEVLIQKTLRAAKEFKAKSVVVCGGVAANEFLKKEFKKRQKKLLAKTKIFLPKKEFSTDNAAMIALSGYFHRNKTRKRLIAKPNLKI